MELINGLLPIVDRLTKAHIKLCADGDIYIKDYCKFRSDFEQTKLYEQGRTAPGKIITYAQAGESFHNYGVAKDAVPIIDGVAIWGDNELWKKIGIKGESLGFEWGGSWKKFKDKVHFQFTGGLTCKQMNEYNVAELNAYLEGYLVGSGLIKTLEIAEKDL